MGELLSFIIGINTLKWLRDARYDAMMQKLPFDIGILVDIMLTEWKTIRHCDPRTGYEAIVDELYTYDLEDLNISAAGMFATADYLAPYCDLVVEIVYDFHEQTLGQLEPIFNNANYNNYYLRFDGFHGPNAVLAKLVPVEEVGSEGGTPYWLQRKRVVDRVIAPLVRPNDIGFIAQEVVPQLPLAVRQDPALDPHLYLSHAPLIPEGQL